MKLNVKAMALTVGILWGAGVFLMTWWLIARGEMVGEKTVLGLFYLGYEVSAKGSFIGLLWAVPDGMIGGALIALLYNKLADVMRKPEA